MFLFSHDWSSNGFVESASAYSDAYSADGRRDDATRVQETLSDLERRVIELSLLDRPSDHREPSRLVRLTRWIFGDYPPNNLANERLEALRRYCIHIRITGGVASAKERGSALACGFSISLLDQAGKLVASSRRG